MGYQDEQIIDGYFGRDTFGAWTEWQRRFRIENGRFENIVKKNFSVYDDGLYLRVRLADNVRQDIEIGLRYVLQSKKIDKQEMQALLGIFGQAVDTIEEEVGIFEAILMSGLLALMNPVFKMFPIRQLKDELTAYLAEMESLKQKLERAKSEKTQAKIDKLIDIAGLVLEFVPEVALAKKAAFAFGSLIADANLGPQNPADNKIARTTGSTFAEPIITHLDLFTTSMTKVASIGGKINAGYDVINWSELDEANKNIADIKAALAAQRGFHERIVKKIWNMWQTQIWSLERQLQQVQRNISDSKKESLEMRDELEGAVKDARYRSPKSWRILT